MPSSLFDGAFTRRSVMVGASVGAGLALAEPSLAQVPAGPRLSFDNPRENVRTLTRLSATLAPGGVGYVRYRGRAFGLPAEGAAFPLYDIDGIGALRAIEQPGGVFRFLFSEFALYLDLATGLPLETWKNPITGRTVEVWHQRNGPVNYALDPAKASFGNFARAGDAAPGFQLPWRIIGDRAVFALDVVADRKNPLDPAEWPLESSGPTLPTTEHSQYIVSRADIERRKLPSLPFVATLQSIKPWHPWMLMGQRPGRVFARMVGEKVSGPEVLAPASLAYARKNLSDFMQPPAAWTGEYVTAHAIYKKTRRPQT